MAVLRMRSTSHGAPEKQYDEARLNASDIVDTALGALRHNSAGVKEARA